MTAALSCTLAIGCSDGSDLRRMGSSCGANGDCASGVCYRGVCSKPCISDDDCDGGTCVQGANVCTQPPSDATGGDGLGVEAVAAADATPASGACTTNTDCLATETCAVGQCLVADTVSCSGKADGTSCANFIVAVTCKGGSQSCSGGWTVAKYGGAPTCQSGACTPQVGVPGWTGQSTCAQDSVCVPSNVGGVQPCQKRARVPACASAP